MNSEIFISKLLMRNNNYFYTVRVVVEKRGVMKGIYGFKGEDREILGNINQWR